MERERIVVVDHQDHAGSSSFAASARYSHVMQRDDFI